MSLKASFSSLITSQEIPKGALSKLLLSTLFFVGVLSLVPLAAADEKSLKPAREYQIKASLAFNFLQFIRWPPDNQGPVRNLCLMGPDQYGTALDDLHNQLVEGSRINVQRLEQNDIQKLSACHVLLIAPDKSINEDKILSVVSDKAILTVGESEDFLARGGIVRLFVQESRVVFDINRTAALGARLQVSSKLLRLARQVYGNR